MFLRELFEAPQRTAVIAFGRMNPPTIGHEKLVNKLKSISGDHFIFLSHSQDPKKNPLDFHTKVKFAEKFFPGVKIGSPNVRTPIDAMKKLDELGYDRVVFVAGSDREASFSELFNKYNGKEYTFERIQVVSAGERDPDAEGAEGMSASKMRAAAASGNLEVFAQGVPDPRLAEELYDAVRRGMGVKDLEPQENIKESILREVEDIKKQLQQAAMSTVMTHEIKALLIDAKRRIEQLEQHKKRFQWMNSSTSKN